MTPYNRNAMPRRIADVIQRLDSTPNLLGMLEARGLLWKLLLDTLEPMQRDVFDAVWKTEYPLTSRDIADIFKIRLNHASTILKGLSDLGLIARTEVMDSGVRHYAYRVKR